jgi:hypothetical protein
MYQRMCWQFPTMITLIICFTFTVWFHALMHTDFNILFLLLILSVPVIDIFMQSWSVFRYFVFIVYPIVSRVTIQFNSIYSFQANWSCQTVLWSWPPIRTDISNLLLQFFEGTIFRCLTSSSKEAKFSTFTVVI